jgi:hypothetical protein
LLTDGERQHDSYRRNLENVPKEGPTLDSDDQETSANAD